ncbi:NADH-quinone oxidoreductase subunit L [Tunturiibacter gelidoferens]|jgi:NADH-quinone oxidoreductase subunit L|uniref:NADH-quinone oxidoreductase subunit L n=1 Tax=Tunturiibacter gelidiferens TaxID=3069689 RepID=A0A9X0QD65_9BACT|nr:NADH-quinone oxidoreductase subunit L [Edaphobacter lichenicola]MBB5328167.1 NADH-quinone oxidoreductase subunit L [Edaphobacter lichenicola]
MPSDYLWLIPIVPFVGFLINGTIGRKFPRSLVTAVALICTAIPAILVAWLWITMKADGAPEVLRVVSKPWIAITGLQIDFAFTVDHLTLIMLGVVTGVGFLIHMYAAGYMAHEEGYWRFFAYLNLFMFFMLVLVLAESFLLLFVGWEGVGLASYLLVGFYFTKDSAANAGKKAFIVNRIGDFGFLLAMFLIVREFGSLDFTHVFQAISVNPDWNGGVITAIALLLVLGATGKSAQIPLYVWLPDAMEGPTPVSALIHAATMVTAGIYMVARCHVLFDRSPYALGVVAIIGAATAIFAACIGMVQHDIKRVLAYSTVSQLGYMFLACGVGAYTAGIFHLLTHAFFKALLFLSAGSVIHALSGEQDMRKMGGLRKRIPVTFWTMTMGVFAISGIPPLAGFFSKDEILYQAFVSTNPIGKLLWFVGLVTAGMTAFYMFRLWFKTFFGPEHFEEHTDLHAHGAAVHTHSDSHTVIVADHEDNHTHGVHESPAIMTVPLAILALLSIIGGWVGIPAAMGGHNEIEHFLQPVFSTGTVVEAATTSPGSELGLAAVSVLVVAIGFFFAFVFYYKKPGTAAAIARRAPALYNFVLNKFYIDEVYSALVITPLLMFSRLFLGGLVDGGIINGSGSAAGATTRGLSSLVRRVQSGNIRSYAGWLALGAAAVLLVMIFGRSIWMH